MAFILHAGFHKTATTHIQRALEAQSDILLDHGVRVASHAMLRQNFTRVIEYQTYRDMGAKAKPVQADEDAQATINGYFEELNNGVSQRLIFSEENIVGHVGQVAFHGDFYQAPKKFTESFRDALSIPPTDILLCVRNYAEFFASSYVEHLGPTLPPEKFVPPHVMAAKVMGNMPSWQRMINMFCNVFPDARIVVWRYEDFKTNYATIMEQFVGSAAAKDFIQALGQTGQDNRDRKSVGKLTMQAFFDRIAKDGLQTALMRWRDIKEQMQDIEDVEPFDPWTDQQKAHLDKMYQRDWAQITTNPRLTILP